MTQKPIPFNTSYHFDERLRDVPDDPEDMARAVAFLKEQLATAAADEETRSTLLGLLGVFQRMLGDLDEAESCLLQAIESSERVSDVAVVQNQIRLAHVYQWRHEFDVADAIYRNVVARCEADGALRRYLDFALQHYGKSLFDQGRFREAAALFQRALDIRVAGGNEELIASSRVARDTALRHVQE